MSWTSGYEAVEAGGTTLHRLVFERAAQAGDRPALIDGPSGYVVSYGTLASRVERVAAGLAERGFGAGDVLALCAPNVVQWAGVTLAAMAAGGAVTGINPGYTERELRGQLADFAASVLVTVPPLAPTALSASSGTRVREVVVLGGPGEEIGGTTSVYELIGGDGPFPESVADPDAVALLPYSSGTTGLPKGVMLTHSNLVTSVRQVLSGLRVTERDTMLAVAPFFHVMGIVVNLAVPLVAGASVVMMSRFDVGGVLRPDRAPRGHGARGAAAGYGPPRAQPACRRARPLVARDDRLRRRAFARWPPARRRGALPNGFRRAGLGAD